MNYSIKLVVIIGLTLTLPAMGGSDDEGNKAPQKFTVRKRAKFQQSTLLTQATSSHYQPIQAPIQNSLSLNASSSSQKKIPDPRFALLPNVLLQGLVFQSLDPVSLARSSCVNRHYNRSAQVTFSNSSSLNIDSRKNTLSDEFMNGIARKYPKLTSLSLGNHEVSLTGLTVLNRLGETLEDFAIGGEDVSAKTIQALSGLTKLKRLSLYSTTVNTDTFAAIALAYPELEELSVSGIVDGTALRDLTSLKNLKKISFSHFDNRMENGDLNLLSEIPKLESVEICSRFFSMNVQRRMKNKRKYKHLAVYSTSPRQIEDSQSQENLSQTQDQAL